MRGIPWKWSLSFGNPREKPTSEPMRKGLKGFGHDWKRLCTIQRPLLSIWGITVSGHRENRGNSNYSALLARLPKFNLVAFHINNMNKFTIVRSLNFVYN